MVTIASYPPRDHPQHLHRVLHLLPHHHLATVQVLFSHLNRLSQHHEGNFYIHITQNDHKCNFSDGNDLTQPGDCLGSKLVKTSSQRHGNNEQTIEYQFDYNIHIPD